MEKNKSPKSFNSKESLKNMINLSFSNIFSNEIEALDNLIKLNNVPNLKYPLKFNFLLSKITEFLLDYKLLIQISRKQKSEKNINILGIDNNLDINSELKEQDKAGEIIKSSLINLICENANNDMSKINKFIRRDQISEKFLSIIENVIKDKCEVIHEIDENKIKLFKFKIFYYKGNNKPQNIKVPAENLNSMSSFKFYLKKKLGIFEFSSFNIIISKENKKGKFQFILEEFLREIDQLNLRKINRLKLVPLDYELNL